MGAPVPLLLAPADGRTAGPSLGTWVVALEPDRPDVASAPRTVAAPRHSATVRPVTRTVEVVGPAPRLRPPLATAALGGVAAGLALLLLAVAGRYGYHRDELYFLRAGRELALGFV